MIILKHLFFKKENIIYCGYVRGEEEEEGEWEGEGEGEAEEEEEFSSLKSTSKVFLEKCYVFWSDYKIVELGEMDGRGIDTTRLFRDFSVVQ